MTDNSVVQKAIAAVKANPPDDGSEMPWKARKANVYDSNGEDVADCDSPQDAAHIAAAVNAAPVLIAEVERLRAVVDAARVAVEKWPEPVHSRFCDHSCGAGCTNHQPCNCGHATQVAARTEARRALGLEVGHG